MVVCTLRWPRSRRTSSYAPGREKDSACGVPELMHCHTQSGHLMNPLRDLAAEQDVAFGASALSWEQPVTVPATEHDRPEVVDVFVDDSIEMLLKRILKADPVLDVIVWEGQPVVRIRSAGLDQVDPKSDGYEIGKAHRRHCEDGDGDCELRSDRGSVWRRRALRSRGRHQVLRQVNHSVPHARGEYLAD